jgi:undecaprenyl phosphate-alpha-L-ara4N flippase subunit ArnE
VSVVTASSLLASGLLAAVGQLLFRIGAVGRVGIMEFVNPYIALGIVAYASSTVLWVFALSRAPLSLVYPFTVLTFVLVGSGAVWFLDETLSATVLIGWLVIILGLGIVVVGSSAR